MKEKDKIEILMTKAGCKGSQIDYVIDNWDKQ